ncbi:MAG: type 1 glutamine amidotransferase [Proteobacteria bacterium]|nr:type 1 glutamine amidotransferase [Pseudomonadota bacterium]HQR04055.1 type 1 glutamine amidotransferase [Rhodocyclaceae bacterium]
MNTHARPVTRPVAIFRHWRGEGPGYFATFLAARSIPHVLVKVDEGEPVPRDAGQFSGLCFMGGPMSVNDDLPWIPQVLHLIRAAAAADIPVIGHCLGAQLMAKALGGSVTRNPVKEIGWGTVIPQPGTASWMEDLPAFEAFHWHGETFSLPPKALRLLSNTHCENQAFALGPHLGMQCHVEMTEDMIRLWSTGWRKENVPVSASVQSPAQMLEHVKARIANMRPMADHLYTRWIGGLKR